MNISHNPMSKRHDSDSLNLQQDIQFILQDCSVIESTESTTLREANLLKIHDLSDRLSWLEENSSEKGRASAANSIIENTSLAHQPELATSYKKMPHAPIIHSNGEQPKKITNTKPLFMEFISPKTYQLNVNEICYQLERNRTINKEITWHINNFTRLFKASEKLGITLSKKVKKAKKKRHINFNKFIDVLIHSKKNIPNQKSNYENLINLNWWKTAKACDIEKNKIDNENLLKMIETGRLIRKKFVRKQRKRRINNLLRKRRNYKESELAVNKRQVFEIKTQKNVKEFKKGSRITKDNDINRPCKTLRTGNEILNKNGHGLIIEESKYQPETEILNYNQFRRNWHEEGLSLDEWVVFLNKKNKGLELEGLFS